MLYLRMPHWGASNWLNNPPTFAPPTVPGNAPFAFLRFPTPNATQVPIDTVMRVGAYDLDKDLRYDILYVYLDGILIFAFQQFDPQFVGRGQIRVIGGRNIIEFAPTVPFEYGTSHTVRVYTEDTLANPYEDTWQFTTEVDPTCYTGNGLLSLESALLSPMQQFLDLEPIRLLLLQQALVNTQGVVLNRDNVAVRALYQMAYDTEISSVLNPYAARNDAALTTRVCTKRKTFDMAQVLSSNMPSLERGIESLFTQGALPREYRNNFADYLDSMLYSYRVSAACTAVFLARAVEQAAGLP